MDANCPEITNVVMDAASLSNVPLGCSKSNSQTVMVQLIAA